MFLVIGRRGFLPLLIVAISSCLSFPPPRRYPPSVCRARGRAGKESMVRNCCCQSWGFRISCTQGSHRYQQRTETSALPAFDLRPPAGRDVKRWPWALWVDQGDKMGPGITFPSSLAHPTASSSQIPRRRRGGLTWPRNVVTFLFNNNIMSSTGADA